MSELYKKFVMKGYTANRLLVALVAAGLGGYLIQYLLYSEAPTNNSSNNSDNDSNSDPNKKLKSKASSIDQTTNKSLPPLTKQETLMAPLQSSKLSSTTPKNKITKEIPLSINKVSLPTTITTSTVIRAAFDVGSGATKFAVAAVGSDLSVGPILTEDNREMLLKHSMVNQILPQSALDKCYGILCEYVDRAKEYRTIEFVGVATAVFREAKNGQEFLDKVRANLGIKIFIASQSFEGQLGYRTASIASNSTKEHHIQRTPTKRKKRQVLSWDSGGGSFQIANDSGGMYGGNVGSSSVLLMMMKLQGKTFHSKRKTEKLPSANPCSLEDCERLHEELMSRHMPKVTEEWLTDLSESGIASGMRVVAIGGNTCAFKMCQIAIGNNIFNSDDLWEAIVNHVGMDDDMLKELSYPQPEMLLPKLVLVYTVMVHVGIYEIEYHHTTGSTLGLLSTHMSDIKKEIEIDEQNRENGKHVKGIGEHKSGVR